jgi:pimeloyl-ACP methyl ester carboxylesterase
MINLAHYTLSDGNKIAYSSIKSKASKKPGIVYLAGYGSDMRGEKPQALEELCLKYDYSYLRFEYLGIGDSSGEFLNYAIADWFQNSLDVIDHLTDGPQLLVGSSMGGWLMLKVAMARKNRIAGLVGIAPAPDFTENLMWKQFNAEHKLQLETNGVLHLKHLSGEDYCVTMKMIEDGRKMLVMDKDIDIKIPVAIIHGMQDMDVPYQLSMHLVDKIESSDVSLHLIKNAAHRFSEPDNLQFMTDVVAQMMNKLSNR